MSSIRVCLNAEAVQKLEGYNANESFDFDSKTIYKGSGCRYIDLSRLSDQLSDAYKGMIESVSFLGRFSNQPSRERGIYRHKSAVAELDDRDSASDKNYPNLYIVHVEGSNFEDVREIFNMIKSGTIRPTQSFEGPQSGLSRVQLEDNLEEFKKRLASCECEVSSLEAQSARRAGLFEEVLKELENKFWPFCRKVSIINKIRCIIGKY